MSEKLQTFEIPQNYSALLNKLEKLAIDLDVNLENITLAKKEVEISINTADSGLTVGDHVPAVTATAAAADVEYSRYISDIWIGVILTLLIVSIIFFICSCFLYHKFQQWKNTYHAGNLPEGNNNDPLNRRFDLDIESLPSYTIVSGLPTYDDALEEFRKAGIILTPKSSVPIIKVFEAESNKEATDSADNVSVNSSCVCGASGTSSPGIIELTPEQLQSLSQKRLSLQISFAPTPTIRTSPRIDLLKQVSRNNMLRNMDNFPGLHRSSSALSLNERVILDQRLRSLQQHRGSLC